MEYEVLLTAVYTNEAESDEVILVESTVERTTTVATTTTTTEAPRFGVKNMRIDEETTFSIRVSWQPVDSRNVRHYRLNYISAKGDRAEETRTVPTGQNSLVLQPLLSDTEYKVAITPVYPDGEGPTASRMGRTLPLSAPKNLRVSEEWYNRFRISWDVPPSPTMGYRVVYQPVSASGPALETFVGEDVSTMLIVNLLSGTEYSVKVIASYTTGSSEALSGRAKTLFSCCLVSATSSKEEEEEEEEEEAGLLMKPSFFKRKGLGFDLHDSRSGRRKPCVLSEVSLSRTLNLPL
ncbi:Collagen alpha-1(XIV) chain [Larimichthys crocea]|uniref:Uncharacterized protein n=1 Tax=Larimichthys crocea TaxID=215358 RepID=A0ACD3RF01_LARCR|nr:Collagen alpha-1(XIV) chain [Larimichthys crocea]